MRLVLVIISLFILNACVPGGTGGQGRRVSNSAESDAIPTPTFSSGEDIYWYHSGTQVNGTLTINADFDNVVYLRGGLVQYFLDSNNNYTKLFCLAINYSKTGALKQLRAKAVPLFITNFSTGTVERIFRIDFSEKTENQASCPGNAGNADSGLGEVAFSPLDLCPTCTTLFSDTSLELYESQANTITDLTQVNSSSLSLSSLGLSIDPSSSQSGGGGGSCTTAECQGLGFDCCLNNQCVNNGAEVPGAATSDPTGYAQAMADITANPANYINWPQFFYVCGHGGVPTPTPTEEPDPIATAQADLQDLINRYYCLSDDFCRQGFNEYCDDSYTCLVGDLCPGGTDVTTTYDTQAERMGVNVANESLACDPLVTGATTLQSIREDVWSLCGCTATSATPFPGDPASVCANFTLKANKNTAGVIESVVCSVPTSLTPTPFSADTFDVSASSVPHRFFRSTNGEAVDDITTLVGSSVDPEGTEFSYLDSENFTDPDNGSFNMNSITGQFATTLDEALPAITINVEKGEIYSLEAVSGSYTPCFTCSKDGWFESFTSHPSLPDSKGWGLENFSYTASRTALNGNTTYGNYGDTQFGRACFLPPTMIPFTHNPDASAQTQRQNRLSAQAALWINGYQRDWFGFNKGAVLASFDGVSWWAIGPGRQVVAPGNKLFLAINGVFGDVADNSSVQVYISKSPGTGNLSEFDYHPDLDVFAGTQNRGASCRRFHVCEKDTDCITKLGWEYACADVSAYQSLWPEFDDEADEQANSSVSKSLNEILFSGFPTSDTKRCVYRGMGATCVTDYSAITDPELRRMFTCAPNFRCVDIDTNNAFNKEINRTPELFENITLGREANYMGRPRFYANPNTSLTSQIKSNLRANATNQGIDANDLGLCMPNKEDEEGTGSPVNFLTQHQSENDGMRTDYISQIANCDSSKTGIDRVRSCPILDEDGNYLYFETFSIADTDPEYNFFMAQNVCGKPSVRNNLTDDAENPFRDIEAGTIAGLVLQEPKVAQDACLRKPGAVCHTDLDCAPNRLHANKALFYTVDYFGGAQAEKDYWSEEMVCGQASELPSLVDLDLWNAYDMSENRCCREVGNTFTMYTAGTATTLGASSDIDPTTFQGGDPTAANRYSRYSSVSDLNISAGTVQVASTTTSQPPVLNTGEIPQPNQWKTLNEAGNNNCCGSWVRLFADGTNNWSNSQRLQISTSSLQCLNYRHEIYKSAPYLTPNALYDLDYSYLCKYMQLDGCVQTTIKESLTEIEYPVLNDIDISVGAFDITTETSFYDSWFTDPDKQYSEWSPFTRLPDDTNHTSGVFTPTERNHHNEDDFDDDPNANYIAFKWPGNISRDPRNYQVFLRVSRAGSNAKEIYPSTAAPLCEMGQACDGFAVRTCPNDLAAVDNNAYCVANNTLHVRFDRADIRADLGWGSNLDFISVIIRFNPQNNPGYFDAGGAIANTELGTKPGSDLYYLSKLGRFELLGIPQIFYEPVMCSDVHDTLIPNVYNSSYDTITEWTDTTLPEYPVDITGGQPTTSLAPNHLAGIYDDDVSSDDPFNTDGGTDEYVAFKDNIQLPDIFSESEFKCCSPLGTTVSSASQCCSGYGVQQAGTSRFTCLLPSNVNLSVYLNKFVSGEGMGDDLPGGGLEEDDFIPYTGEPKLRDETNNKIKAIGEAYCQSGSVVRGGAFGEFIGEPFVGQIQQDEFYSITDSINDIATAFGGEERGWNSYVVDGKRWNHHFYCE